MHLKDIQWSILQERRTFSLHRHCSRGLYTGFTYIVILASLSNWYVLLVTCSIFCPSMIMGAWL
ncbi:uncharacterized protein BO96DRAFT_186312 [Aspergillus niger CBS 101883]|uniref:Uncharacterized protein n=1 Tax=Aspergillus niger ATCC 13496 TaxID=1353008 RepID=A0A370C2Q7_ASPNG|nr:uncharacterized protein BO96DRAFT_186312 [Aspergillus niger CBS 101883]PYH60260.1 hypothetical protein BO96DRAFT_186312 [Aspergillus niger CBS 101883]RDH19701.1 hypothetical protein M747DRAFT_48241 [Aspergillus niger ATCC 13496]